MEGADVSGTETSEFHGAGSDCLRPFPSNYTLGKRAVMKPTFLILCLLHFSYSLKMMIDHEFHSLFQIFADMPKDTSATPWVHVQLCDLDLSKSRRVKIADFLFPSPMTARSHPVNQFSRLHPLEFLGAYWLHVILDNHFNREPRGNN